MKLVKEINKKESGQAFILALIMLLVGSLIIAPLMGFMATGLIAGQALEKNMNEVFAADAGIEDAIYNIINASAPHYDYLQDDLDVNEESDLYTLSQQVNGLSVSYTIIKKTLISGLVGDDSYKLDQPHEDWATFEAPEEVTRNYEEGWVEYSCTIIFNYTGGGIRRMKSLGAFFAPYPGDGEIDIASPYDVVFTPVLTSDYLEADSPETGEASGGFAFIWSWQNNDEPQFHSDDTGTISFKFKIYDPDWAYSLYFVWAIFKEQDVSYVTNAPGLYKWVIEATAGGTTIRAVVIPELGESSVLIWEINPP